MFFSTFSAGAIAAIFASLLISTSAAEAAKLAPCDVLPASEASQIVGVRVSGMTSGSPVMPSCLYSSQRPIFGFGLQAFSSESDAGTMFKRMTARSRPMVAFRQKGMFVLSAISMNHDGSKLAALLDAAAKHL